MIKSHSFENNIAVVSTILALSVFAPDFKSIYIVKQDEITITIYNLYCLYICCYVLLIAMQIYHTNIRLKNSNSDLNRKRQQKFDFLSYLIFTFPIYVTIYSVIYTLFSEYIYNKNNPPAIGLVLTAIYMALFFYYWNLYTEKNKNYKEKQQIKLLINENIFKAEYLIDNKLFDEANLIMTDTLKIYLSYLVNNYITDVNRLSITDCIIEPYKKNKISDYQKEKFEGIREMWNKSTFGNQKTSLENEIQTIMNYKFIKDEIENYFDN